MNVDYDQETDTLTVTLRAGRILESDEVRPGVIVDYDEAGEVVGFEVLAASQVMDGFARSGFGAELALGRLREDEKPYGK